jgi:methylthioribose-1-phosphate isomerase
MTLLRAKKEIEWLIKNADRNAHTALDKIGQYQEAIRSMQDEHKKESEKAEQLKKVLEGLE